MIETNMREKMLVSLNRNKLNNKKLHTTLNQYKALSLKMMNKNYSQ